ncbi:MAG: N-acetylneuraminate synthase family protein [Candidatus Gastranaerophilales bacterium]|nr:N-acetylneuraminate synthase family protein [Candidatus Gastranaerophilales bacterium]
MKKSSKPLFIFELANNHNGKLERGIRIISEIKKQTELYKNDFDFAFKLQYRNLETFIHPDYKKPGEIKCINRLIENKLSNDYLLTLKNEITKQGFTAICTAFDEDSVDLILEHGFEIIKIASCSFCDSKLMEKIFKTNLPVIASTAGVKLEEIDKAVEFFLHNGKSLSLMHCIAQYPTQRENLQLNQIDLLKFRYPQVKIGYSTHEYFDMDTIKIAIAKGAVIFEKHVGLNDYPGSINNYSATPEQIGQWLKSAKEAFDACGITGERYKPTQSELGFLQNLSRGIFASKNINKGEKINSSNTFLAVPSLKNQILPANISENKEFKAKNDIKSDSPILFSDVEVLEKIKSLI